MLFQPLHVADGELARGASVARALGSDFVADILEAAQRQLGKAPELLRMIEEWPGDPARAAVAMRFNGALHALARRGDMQALATLYKTRSGDFDGPIGDALSRESAAIASWMQRPPQTNEVGRAAAIVAALTVAQDIDALPIELLEIGSSAGLNLNLGLYGYDLGGVMLGDPLSSVQMAPRWNGPAIHPGPIGIVAARGVDLDPLDPADEATRDRLLAYVWADQPARADRLTQALAIARRHPPRVDRQDAASWLAERLAEPQDEGICRVVFHSMVLQYLTAPDRALIRQMIEAAGARATALRPLVWIGYEWNPARTSVRLTMTRWPGGETRDLARCHAYGAWIDWSGS
ncbi:DUF2332 family protein [Sphingomonas aliaeris]|uniref:DUF2332 family protein n=1 Tax=Sphingomonas aliaeris TaxID=2759526 RepID=A0A974NTU7_9SPHN|nr:DUF2332 family protein [Sphingomonas aliaeris]QQV76710.1 DUF2332 family protein [Sphingomonas aliaeris]